MKITIKIEIEIEIEKTKLRIVIDIDFLKRINKITKNIKKETIDLR